jgi:hypothetical protein
VTLCLLASPPAARADSTPPGFQPSDLQKIVSLADLRTSPDDQRVAVHAQSAKDIVRTTDVYRRQAGWMDRHLK